MSDYNFWTRQNVRTLNRLSVAFFVACILVSLAALRFIIFGA